MAEPPVRYLPPELAQDLENWAPPEVSGPEMFGLYRIAERIYAAGYDLGHDRGRREGRDYQARPSVNDVKQLREQLKAKAVGS